MRWGKFLLVLAAAATLSALPQVNGVYVNPNPFSPNGDGRADTTQIGFSLSGPAYIRLIVQGSPPDTLIDSTLLSSGSHSLLWDGAGYSDGSYTFLIFGWDTLGTPIDTVSSMVVIDKTPPSLSSISAVPNPFSPDNDGVDDYLRIEFTASNTSPPGYDSYLLPSGRIAVLTIVGTASGNTYTTTPDNSPTMPPFPVYFTLLPHHFTVDNVTLHFIDWNNTIVDVTVEETPALLNRVGDLSNRFESLNYWADELSEGDTAVLYLYAFTGNATVTILDSTGNEVFQHNFYQEFHGDDTYSVLWGPGPYPDGLYTYKIFLEDDAYNLDQFTGSVVANSVPTSLSDLTVTPPIISPENHDGQFDVASISYNLSEDAQVTIKIYNSPSVFDSTTLVRTLIESEGQSGGPHSVPFDGKDDGGNYLAQGSDSTYTIVVDLYDPLTGDGFQATTEVEIDNLPPQAPDLDTLSLSSPTSDSTDTLKGFSEAGSHLEIMRNGDLLGTAEADTLTGYFSFVVSYLEGNNYIFAVPYDEVMNRGATSDTLYVLYDSTAPILMFSMPSDSSYVTDTLSDIRVAMWDELSGVNLDSSDLRLFKGGVPVLGTLDRLPPDTLRYVLDDPLVPGGVDDGIYDIRIEMRDSAGNVKEDTLIFTFDTRPPEAQIYPSDSDFVNALDSSYAILSDELSGVDMSAADLQLSGPLGAVSGSTYVRDTAIIFVPSPPLATDGTEDGRYYITLSASDIAGNADTLESEFIYDTKKPVIAEVNPPGGLVSTPISSVFAVLSDLNPGRESSGIDFGASSVRLYRDSLPVSGQKVTSGDTVFWVLSEPLSEDGSYEVFVRAVDNAGNRDSLSTDFLLDLHGPVISSSFPSDGSYVTESISRVVVYFDDGNGSGVESVTMTVIGPGGQSVPGNLTLEGDSAVYQFTVPLSEDGSDDGSYTVVVTASDAAGWPLEPQNPTTLRFTFDTQAPGAVEFYPQGLVNLAQMDTVWARISDLTSGVDLGASNISLKREGSPVPGQVIRREPDTLLYVVSGAVLNLKSKAGKSLSGILDLTDGNYYTIVTAVDSAGNIGVDSSQFTLDRTPPQIILSPEDSSYLSRVDSILMVLRDQLSGPNTSLSSLFLTGPQGPVNGNISVTESTVAFIPYPPLRTDGSDDGRYFVTATAVDNAGNADTLEATFIFDTRPPVLIASFPAPDATVGEEVNWIWILPSDSVVSGREPSGVNYQASEIYVITEDDDSLPGTIETHGDTLYYILSSPLTVGGNYTVSVRIYDNVFNEDSSSWTFLLDVSAPYVSATYPPDSGFVADTLYSLQVVLEDQSGSGINPDTALTRVELENYYGQAVPGSNNLSGDTITFTLSSPILPNGAADGLYRFLVYAQDLAGHPLSPSNPDTFVFIYDSRPPRVVETYPDSGAVGVVPQDSVYALVSDIYQGISAVSGVNLEGSYLILLYPDSTGVPGYLSRVDLGNGEGRLVWHIDPGAGFPGGEYSLSLHLSDRAGHTVDLLYTFTVPDREPIVISTSPADGAVVNSVSSVSAVVLDRTGSGIDTVNSYIQLYDPSDSLMDGGMSFTAEDSLWTFTLELSEPLTANGTYSMKVFPLANDSTAGDIYESHFLLDTGSPQIVFASIQEGDTLYSVPDSFLFVVTDLSGLDTSHTRFALWDAAYDSVALETRFLGDTVLVDVVGDFTAEGVYHLFRMFGDLAGNVRIDTLDFYYWKPLSAVTYVKPTHGDLIEVENGDTVRVQIDGAVALLRDRVGAGLLDISVYLTKGPNDTLSGVADTLNDSTFAWYIDVPLAADGSDNGVYYVIVSARNAVGDSLLVKNRFIYLVDTVPPPEPSSMNIPDRTSNDTITISGKTEPFALVMLFVNTEFRDSTRAAIDSTFTFSDVQLSYGIPNEIWLFSLDDFGNSSDTVKFTVFVGPPEFEVSAPRPMNLADNSFRISLPRDAHVRISVYNLQGDFVWRAEADLQAGSDREIAWEGLKNSAGNEVKNGVYLYIVEARYSDGTVSKKKDFFAVVR
ncbi:MAG TPA: hypothetical protein ENG67_01810 [candidate division WOR-3 bacterium]|uniref:Ig-like domain-containing protein n=1 Tax=candidate division WOR-3 bacterium TaxID=2052148 RepID=A0A7C0XAK4_UNCW3|nr:hypothetical protein [candidate division WOR-3 bacterium]